MTLDELAWIYSGTEKYNHLAKNAIYKHILVVAALMQTLAKRVFLNDLSSLEHCKMGHA